jgi:hypothetical protein
MQILNSVLFSVNRLKMHGRSYAKGYYNGECIGRFGYGNGNVKQAAMKAYSSAVKRGKISRESTDFHLIVMVRNGKNKKPCEYYIHSHKLNHPQQVYVDNHHVVFYNYSRSANARRTFFAIYGAQVSSMSTAIQQDYERFKNGYFSECAEQIPDANIENYVNGYQKSNVVEIDPVDQGSQAPMISIEI